MSEQPKDDATAGENEVVTPFPATWTPEMKAFATIAQHYRDKWEHADAKFVANQAQVTDKNN